MPNIVTVAVLLSPTWVTLMVLLALVPPPELLELIVAVL